jgi:hypothetical protein
MLTLWVKLATPTRPTPNPIAAARFAAARRAGGRQTGFELLASLEAAPHVIFTTTYDEYAL